MAGFRADLMLIASRAEAGDVIVFRVPVSSLTRADMASQVEGLWSVSVGTFEATGPTGEQALADLARRMPPR